MEQVRYGDRCPQDRIWRAIKFPRRAQEPPHVAAILVDGDFLLTCTRSNKYNYNYTLYSRQKKTQW